MLQLQKMVNPDADPEVLDLKNFENMVRVIDAVQKGKAADGTPWKVGGEDCFGEPPLEFAGRRSTEGDEGTFFSKYVRSGRF